MAAAVESNYSFTCIFCFYLFIYLFFASTFISYYSHTASILNFLNFVTLKTETNTWHLWLFFISGNLAKLHCVFTLRCSLTAWLIFLFVCSINAENIIVENLFFSLKVVLEGIRGPGIEGDIAIDDVTLEEGECRDPPPSE